RVAGGAERLYHRPVDDRLCVGRALSALRPYRPAAGDPARRLGRGGGSDHRDRGQIAGAASRTAAGLAFRRARICRTGGLEAAVAVGRPDAGAAQHRRRRDRGTGADMTGPGAPAALVAHLAVLSVISFGGVPTVLPDLREFVVAANGWLTDPEF